LRTPAKELVARFALFGNSKGVVEGQHFYQATQNGARTAIKNARFKEFWILI